MRTNRRLVAASVLAIASLATTPVFAQANIAGAYDVKFQEMSTNCSPVPASYTRGTVKIDVSKSSLRVNIETIPQMIGVPAKSGKINAKMPKKAAFTVQGLDVKSTVSGRVDDNGVLQLVLVSEYTRIDNGKPYCTQSWNLSGVRAGAATSQGGAGSDAGSGKAKPKSMLDGLLPGLGD
jgi:hypothetical protein